MRPAVDAPVGHGVRGAEDSGHMPEVVERVRGIEPPYSAWEADVLPLNYTRRTRILPFPGAWRQREARPQIVMISPMARSQ